MRADSLDTMDVDSKPASGNITRKGRGFTNGGSATALDNVQVVPFRLDADQRPPAVPRVLSGKAQKSIEGWIVIATNLHQETGEDDLREFFGEYGNIQNLHLNLDRRSGYVKGYALIEYEKKEEAEKAVSQANGAQLLEQALVVDFALVQGSSGGSKTQRDANSGRRGRRDRSASPGKKEIRTTID